MIRSRLAPTPSGYLHIGNLYSFILTWLLTRKQGGVLLLRIDDLDAERFRPEYLEDIFRKLETLGITWDEGPSAPEDFGRNWSQQLRLPAYENLIGKLISTGHVYACNCSRNTLDPLNHNCLHQKNDCSQPGSSLRLHLMPDAVVTLEDKVLGKVQTALSELMYDPVIRKKNGQPSFQVASLADDMQFGINLIVRGEDLLASTLFQLYMANLLGESEFGSVTFYHHPLAKTASGEKLSKSAGHGAKSDSNETVINEVFARMKGLPMLPSGIESLQRLEELLERFTY